MTAIMRLPSPAYVIQKTLAPDSVKPNGRWPTAVQIVEDLERAGWRLVPGRRPSSRSNEESAPLMVEGQISSQQLIDYAAEFDRLDEDVFSAAEFVAWLNAEVRNSPEWQWLERKRLSPEVRQPAPHGAGDESRERPARCRADRSIGPEDSLSAWSSAERVEPHQDR